MIIDGDNSTALAMPSVIISLEAVDLYEKLSIMHSPSPIQPFLNYFSEDYAKK